MIHFITYIGLIIWLIFSIFWFVKYTLKILTCGYDTKTIINLFSSLVSIFGTLCWIILLINHCTRL